MVGGGNQIGLVARLKRLQSIEACIFQLHGSEPAQLETLTGGVSGRGLSIAVVATITHDIPRTDGIELIVCVVIIRQTQHVAELMAECTDTAHR